MKKFRKKRIITTQDIALMGMMLATLEAVKRALAFATNIELVSLLIILYTLYFGWRIFYVIAAFVLIEGCLYGFGIWWLMYVYVWPLLAFLTYLFRKKESVFFWSCFSGIYGLLFGALCTLPYFLIEGINMVLTWWMAGIFYDVLHGISNFILCMVLFIPLKNALIKLRSHLSWEEKER